MSDLIHLFEQAGLGKAPFRFVAVRENVFRAGDCIKAGGSCDFCGTGIRWECVIESADGHKHVVGSDCIHKVGDKGLRSKVAQERNRIAREERFEAAEAARLVALDEQRARNGGEV